MIISRSLPALIRPNTQRFNASSPDERHDDQSVSLTESSQSAIHEIHVRSAMGHNGRASSQKVQVYNGMSPTAPYTYVTTSTEPDPKTHSIVTNVFVTTSGSRKKAIGKKARRKRSLAIKNGSAAQSKSVTPDNASVAEHDDDDQYDTLEQSETHDVPEEDVTEHDNADTDIKLIDKNANPEQEGLQTHQDSKQSAAARDDAPAGLSSKLERDTNAHDTSAREPIEAGNNADSKKTNEQTSDDYVNHEPHEQEQTADENEADLDEHEVEMTADQHIKEEAPENIKQGVQLEQIEQQQEIKSTEKRTSKESIIKPQEAIELGKKLSLDVNENIVLNEVKLEQQNIEVDGKSIDVKTEKNVAEVIAAVDGLDEEDAEKVVDAVKLIEGKMFQKLGKGKVKEKVEVQPKPEQKQADQPKVVNQPPTEPTEPEVVSERKQSGPDAVGKGALDLPPREDVRTDTTLANVPDLVDEEKGLSENDAERLYDSADDRNISSKAVKQRQKRDVEQQSEAGTSLGSNNSLQGSVSVHEDEEDIEDEGLHEEVIERTINLSPGEQFRAATTFEFRADSPDAMENNLRVKVHSNAGTESRCGHRLHFKQTLSSAGPIDVSHVQSKVKTRSSRQTLRNQR